MSLFEELWNKTSKSDLLLLLVERGYFNTMSHVLSVTLNFIAHISLFICILRIETLHFNQQMSLFSKVFVLLVLLFYFQSSSFNSSWVFCGLNLLVIYYSRPMTRLNNNKTKEIMLWNTNLKGLLAFKDLSLISSFMQCFI